MEGGETEPPETKLTRSKIRRALEHPVRPEQRDGTRQGRLPPGQHLTTKWPVLDLGVQPEIRPGDWSLTLDGIVDGSRQLSWHDVLDLPQVDRRSDIHCVTAWSRYDNEWTGIATSDLLDAFPPLPDRRFVSLESYDGYTTNLSLADFGHPDALLAHSWSGDLLTREHGGPLRLVVPHLYFWKSPKWIRRLSFVVDDDPGFWEGRGYHNRGDPWAEERYS